MIFYCSKMKTITLFCPLAYFVTFIFSDLLPLYLPQEKDIPSVMYTNTNIAIIINLFFLFHYKHLYAIRPTQELNKYEYDYRSPLWIKIVFIFASLYVFSGIMTGTLQGFLSGADMEDERRTAEIGVGFLRDIPLIGSQIILLIIFVYKGWEIKIQVFFICLFFGIVCVATTGGNRAPLLSWMSVFVTYMAFTYRGFKWYEYILWNALFNIGGTFLGAIRRGEEVILYLSQMTWADVFCGYQNIIFNNSISLINVVHKSGFFYGEEMVSNAVYFIPRFLWAEKPVSFGYKMKDLAGYKFDGGGIMPTGMEYCYVNWGDFWIIDYVLYLIILHYLFKKILFAKSYFYQMCYVIFIFNINYMAHIVKQLELFILFFVLIKIIYSIYSIPIKSGRN